MNPDYKNLTKIPYFRRAVLQNFPFIEEDFDALTDYALLCKVVEYLNKVIKQQNLVNDNTNALYQSYIQLKNFVDNYFDNLDVQEEINNKLDAMAQDGTLQEIISDYLNSKAVFGFDNVNMMKNATNLINGSYAQTLGFYQKNDGGGSLYKIRAITNDDIVDNIFIIELNDNTLIAELIINDINNIKTFGVYGDGLHNDLANIQYAINKLSLKTLYFPRGIYLIADKIIIKNANNKTVNLLFDDNAVLKNYTNNSLNCLIEIGKDISEGTYNRTSQYNIMNIKGGKIDCTNVDKGILINSNRQFVNLTNVNFFNITNYGLYLEKGSYTSGDSKIISCTFFRTDSSDGTAIYCGSNDNELQHIRIDGNKTGIKFTGGGYFCHDIHATALYNNEMNTEIRNQTIAFDIQGDGIHFSQCYADTYSTGFKIKTSTGTVINNCVVYYYDAMNDDSVSTGVLFDGNLSGDYSITNTVFNSARKGTHRFIHVPKFSSRLQITSSQHLLLTNNIYNDWYNTTNKLKDIAYIMQLNKIYSQMPYTPGSNVAANDNIYLCSFIGSSIYPNFTIDVINQNDFLAKVEVLWSSKTLNIVNSSNNTYRSWTFILYKEVEKYTDDDGEHDIYSIYVSPNRSLDNALQLAITPIYDRFPCVSKHIRVYTNTELLQDNIIDSKTVSSNQ